MPLVRHVVSFHTLLHVRLLDLPTPNAGNPTGKVPFRRKRQQSPSLGAKEKDTVVFHSNVKNKIERSQISTLHEVLHLLE